MPLRNESRRRNGGERIGKRAVEAAHGRRFLRGHLFEDIVDLWIALHFEQEGERDGIGNCGGGVGVVECFLIFGKAGTSGRGGRGGRIGHRGRGSSSAWPALRIAGAARLSRFDCGWCDLRWLRSG